MTNHTTPLNLDDIETRAAKRLAALSGWLNCYSPLPEQEALEGAEGVLKEAVPALLAEVRRLRAELAELEGPAVEARAALAALCYDLEDPGSNALGALYLISRATVGVEAPKDEAAQVLASHDAEIMRRCAEFVRDTYDGEWVDDAAATLERDADICERGCPGYVDAGRGDTVAERLLANCKHCGKPRTGHGDAR